MLTTELCAHLREKYPILLPEPLACFQCSCAVLDLPEDLQSGAVVVGQADEYLPQNLYLVCSSGKPPADNAAVYSDPALTLPLYREVCRLLEPDRRLARRLAALDRACLEGGLEELAARAREYLGNPVLFVDRAFNTLAMAPRAELGVDSWDRVLRGEPVEEGDLQQAQQAMDNFRKKKLSGPQIIPYTEPDGRHLRRLVCSAEVDGRDCGGLEVVELERPFQPEDKILVHRLCELIGHQLTQTPDSIRPSSMEEQILRELLLYGTRDEERMKRRLKQLGRFPEGGFYLLASIPLTHIHQLTGSNLRALLARQYAEGWCVLLEEHLLLLLPMPEDASGLEALTARLDATGLKMEQPVILSMPFRSLLHLEKVWKFNWEASKLAASLQIKPGCLLVGDLFERIFFKRVCSSMDITPFVHSAVQELEQYDRENKTELLNTLGVFLTHNCDLNEAARALYVHRNTLVYRLRRIEKLIHMNLKDPGTRQVLSLGCKLRLSQR